MVKRIYRSETNRVFAGIFGGLGEYFDLDPVLLRLAFAGLTVLSGILPGVLFYIIALFIVPRRPAGEHV